MDETREAEAFCAGLDRLLAGGRTAEGADTEALMDLAMASRIMTSDLSRQSRVRHTLKNGLLGGAAPDFRAPRRMRWGMAAAYAGVAALALAPVVADLISAPEKDSTGYLASGFSAAGPYPAGSNEIGDAGMNQLARGGLIGSSSNDGVVTPLNVRDPSNLVMEGAPELQNTEGYDHISENVFRRVADRPLSTFSIDVDAASYANVRRFLAAGTLPPKDAVRVEELVNYFAYDYPEPPKGRPLSITAELAACPWNDAHRLVRIGLKGRSVATRDLPPNNLVFLIDSSGSMNSPDKLPLLKAGFRLLVEELRPVDRVAIVTYAGAAGLVLPSTSGEDKRAILEAVDRLGARGSTAGSQGILLAYQTALGTFLKKGTNRVILATDGDFNVGVTSDGDLVRLIEEERKKGVFLTVLGFGTGNYQDSKMKKLADSGNGNYAYVDTLAEAKKVLVQEMGATLLTVAKDVKLQVEFNPARASAYRLIGYESRLLKAEDFRDDRKDAGELGAGHTVTALYEVVPTGVPMPEGGAERLKYQRPRPADSAASSELLTVKFRYKEPGGDVSKEVVAALEDQDRAWSEASGDLKFAAAAAGFGMILRESEFRGSLSFAKVRAMAKEGLGSDVGGHRAEFVGLVEKAERIGMTPKILR